MKIKKIQKIENDSNRCDLSVGDNENFFANGILVHNCTMYKDYIHARSLSDKKHWSKSWVKGFHGSIAHDIPEDMRFVVENLYAKHSIKYTNLESYCYGISAWLNMTCLDWDLTCEWFALLEVPMVPVLYRGVWDEEKIKNICLDYNLNEGYVVRLTNSFHYKDFSKNIAKYVRANHVSQNSQHWFNSITEINLLKDKGAS